MSPCRPALALAALLLATVPVEPARPPPPAGRDDDALGALGFISPPSDPDAGPGLSPGLSPGEAVWAWTAAGRCPYYCTCLRRGGLRRANCADRRLGSVDLGLPADTEAADLDFNVITVLDDGCFQEQGLVRLRELSLRHNAIHTVGALAFNGLRRLHRLDLSYNHLQTIHPSTFASSTGLKTLLLAGNNLARLPGEVPLLAAPRLQLLDLGSCKLAHLGTAVLSELPALAHLNLSGNYLIQLQPQALAKQRRLQLLDLTHNPLACDYNTRQQLLELQLVPERNATVLHSCQSGKPVAQLQSKLLARLLTDMVPEQGVQSGQRSPRPSHQEMVIVPETESFEEDFEKLADSTTFTPYTVEGPPSCPMPPLFPERSSKNPILFKEWFDPIPSFWAGVFGCQVGLVLGLVLSSCACRLTFCRSVNSPCAERNEAGPTGLSGSEIAVFTEGSDVTDDEDYGSESMIDTSSLSARGFFPPSAPARAVRHPFAERRVTPPPSYDDLMTGHQGWRAGAQWEQAIRES